MIDTWMYEELGMCVHVQKLLKYYDFFFWRGVILGKYWMLDGYMWGLKG